MTWRVQRFPSAVLPRAALAARIAAIVFALVVSGIVLAFTGINPVPLGGEVISATFGSDFELEDLALLFTPLILTGLAVAVTLRVGIWNIGAEGQFYMGAFGATAVGLFVDGPAPLVLTTMVAAGIAGGALWILVPTLARAYAEVNELITTLLLNFVASLIVYYVSTGPWHERGTMTFAATPRITYALPEFYGSIHWGFVVAIALNYHGGGACVHQMGLRGPLQRRQSPGRPLRRHPGPATHRRRDAAFRRDRRHGRHDGSGRDRAPVAGRHLQ